MRFDHDMDERSLTAVHSHLEDATFMAVEAEGRAMTLEQAIACALCGES